MIPKIEKPKHRSQLRRKLGKEYFILKRKYAWLFGGKKWAKRGSTENFPFLIKEHKSLILRPLKDVDMYLQHNKRKNLELAIRKIDGLILQPGDYFSLWKLVGRPSKRKG
mgnify:CR=1 FL=1